MYLLIALDIAYSSIRVANAKTDERIPNTDHSDKWHIISDQVSYDEKIMGYASITPLIKKAYCTSHADSII